MSHFQPQQSAPAATPAPAPASTKLKSLMRIAKGSGQFYIEVCCDDQFEKSLHNHHTTWTSTRGDQNKHGKMWNFKPLIDFRAESSVIQFKEQWFQYARNGQPDANNKVVGQLEFGMDAFDLVFMGEQSLSEIALVILLRLKSDKTIAPVDFSKSTPAWKFCEDEVLATKRLAKNDLVKHIKFVRITFVNYKTNKFVLRDQIERFFAGNGQQTMSGVLKKFIENHKRALEFEWLYKERELAALVRNGCTVRTFPNPENSRELHIDIYSAVDNDMWELKIDQKIVLSDPIFFLPDAPAKDLDGASEWTATVVDLIGTYAAVARINNVIANVYPYIGETIINVTCKVVESEPMASRLYKAVENAEDCFRFEAGEMTPDEQTEKNWADLHIPLSRLFTRQNLAENSEGEAMPLSLKNHPRTNASNFHLNDVYVLNVPSHEKLVRTTFAGRGGISAAHGPPATGKTTLLAKIAFITKLEANFDGKIVLTAHSNAAATVLLEKMHVLAAKMEFPAKNSIVYVQTPGAVVRQMHSDNPLHPDLQSYALEAHIACIALADPERLEAYTMHHDRVTTGEKLTDVELEQYFRARNMAQQQLRHSATFFICTTSTVNTSFFQQRLVGGAPFNCFMAIVDEASQCSVPSFLEVWIRLNPRHLVIGGDDKQLQCYAQSDFAMSLWARSPMTYSREMGPDFCVLLDVQFRMSSGLYFPTNVVHYNGMVGTAKFSNGVPKEKAYLQIFGRIEVDSFGTGAWQRLDSTMIVFDVLDGAQCKFGVTSSANNIEATLIGRFLNALKSAGASPDHMMLLTPYQGQYRLLCNVRQSMGADELEVRKIGSCQGDEKPIVIYSATRTGDPGFLRSTQRQNVGTSRQEGGFVMFGTMECLTRDPTWRKWLDAVKGSPLPGQHHIVVNKDCQFRCYMEMH